MQTYTQTMTSVGNNAFISASSVVMVLNLCCLLIGGTLVLGSVIFINLNRFNLRFDSSINFFINFCFHVMIMTVIKGGK